MWHIDAEIICFVFMLVIVVDVFKSGAAAALKDRLFSALALTTILAIAADIISSAAMVYYQTTPWWLVQGSLVVYFLLTPLLSVLWHLYALAVVSGDAKIPKRTLVLSLGPFAAYLVAVLSNPYTGWMFSLSAANEYARGPLFSSLYLLFYGYSAATLTLALLFFGKAERTTSIVLSTFPLVAGLGVLFQQLLPGYLITGASFTLVLLITYLFLQNRKATRDLLTGINNRTAFLSALDRLAKNNDPGVVLAVAVDDFKLFNQTFGQANGDRLLCQIAGYLVGISSNKTCYRYGGDIFTLIVRNLHEKDGLKLANSIMDKFSQSFYIDGIGYSVSVSLGIVEYPHKSEEKNNSLITALDFAIYQAKRRGKGQIAFFNEDLIRAFRRKHAVMEAITRAIKNQSFQVYIQPIYQTAKKKFVFGEALLRLHDESLGWISPGEFVPIAEETGQIVQITYFVLDRVCSFLKRNRKVLNDDVSLSVNLSVIQFMQNDMVERIKSIIQSYNIPPGLIKLEITESVIAESFDDIKTAMLQLNEFGICFALDDYGQGYSNISYLINLPFSFVKLDKSIIDYIAEDNRFICALVPMFKSLHKILIAEGVETREQVEILDALCCDTIQGFYFSQPLPMDQAVELLNSGCESRRLDTT